jgi:phenylalanyl-tRNA synthetase beta chain
VLDRSAPLRYPFAFPMKVSLRWLRELCPSLPDDKHAVAARLTGAGLEIEGMTEFGSGTEICVVASVTSTRPHPSRSGLRMVTVDRGGSSQEVVCGAPNVPDAGGLVVLAPLGTHLPAKGMTIERRSIAGVPSEGMLCSEAELGLGDDGDGILVLPAGSWAPGTPLSKALPAARDTIFEIGLTPNRPDGLGHLGLAREAAALFGVSFDPPLPEPPAATRGDALAKHVTVAIEDGERCPHYGAAVLLAAHVGPSPMDVRWRLTSLGVRPISNVVDVTNLVMLEYGHPMHAFDLDKVRGGRIVVRAAQAGEKIRTLDGVDRALVSDDLVICDGDGPVAIAGVMGGGDSEITAATQRVLLECAYFEPRGIRRAARRHGLHTESSHRFERGVDWGDTSAALARAVSLVAKLSGAAALEETRIFEARPLARRTVSVRHDRLSRLLGTKVDPAVVRATLHRLGFVLRSKPTADAVADTWEVPSFRPDVSREVDLIEEAARTMGMDAIPTELPAIRPSRDAGPREALARRARGAGVAIGLSEAMTYAFVSPKDLEAVGAPTATVVLRNPLTEERSVMRTSLVPELLRAVAHARRRGEREARLFAVGRLFLASGSPRPEERLAFAAVIAGDRPSWLSKPAPVDVWDAKGVAEAFVARMTRREASVVAAVEGRPSSLHPRGAAWIHVDGERVGQLGPLHPDVADAFDVGEGTLVVEVDLAALDRIGVRPARFAPLPRFPATTRDLAVVVRDDVPAGDVKDAVAKAAGLLGVEVSLFDRFAGGNVPAGHASLAVRVVYRADDRTLTDAEVDACHAGVVSAVETRFGATLRA